MHELARAFLHFDPPPPGPAGGMTLQGWVVAKPGHHYADVRTRVGDRVFPGVHGIPREDLAQFFQSPKRYLLAGFSVTMPLPAGRHRVEFEALTLEGRWEHLDGLDWEAGAPAALPDDVERTPLNADGMGEALRTVLRRAGNEAGGVASIAREVVAGTPARHHLQHPPRPFHGHLDQPRTRERSLFGRLPISGWMYHESQPIKRILATADLQAVQELKLGRATVFLGERSGHSPLATHCGYDGFLDLPAQLPQPVAVRVYAELADGSWHLGSVARFAETDQEFLKLAYGRFSPLAFWRAWRALVRAMQAAGWPLPDGRGAVIRQVWREYSAQAPRRAARTPVPVTAAAAPPAFREARMRDGHNRSQQAAEGAASSLKPAASRWLTVAQWGLAAVVTVSLATLAIQSVRRSNAAQPVFVVVGLDANRNTFAELPQPGSAAQDADTRFIQLASTAENLWRNPAARPLPAAPASTDSHGYALFDPGSQQGFIAIEQLPALAENQRYHLWVVDAATGHIRDAGVLPLAGLNRGLYSFALEPNGTSKADNSHPNFFITIEDAGTATEPAAKPRGKVVLGKDTF